METSITCSVCSKIYRTQHGYNNHISLNRCKVKDDSVICKYCDKSFSNKYHRKTHELKCINHYKNTIQTLQEEIQQLKQAVLPTNTNNITNINNGNINNTIIINNLGNEDISHITQKQMIRLLRMNKECPVEMIKMIHFNANKPENHNVYKPNFKDKYVKYCDNNIWKIGDLMKIVTELYLSKMDIAEEKFDELKQFLEDSKKDRFQQLLDNREEPEIMGGILKRIIEILYNEKSVITDKLK
jgi:hypothetical protein